jgi:hypothetical protein
MSGETSLPWWQVRAPPPLRRALVTYALMVVPATMGVVWKWSWLLTTGLTIPGLVAHEILGYQAGKARGIRLRIEMPHSKRMRLAAGVVGLVGVLVVSRGPQSALPLEIVVGLLLFVEPVWRLEWRHDDRQLQAGPAPQASESEEHRV